MQQLLQINALNANKLNVQRNWTSKVTDGTVAENPEVVKDTLLVLLKISISSKR